MVGSLHNTYWAIHSENTLRKYTACSTSLTSYNMYYLERMVCSSLSFTMYLEHIRLHTAKPSLFSFYFQVTLSLHLSHLASLSITQSGEATNSNALLVRRPTAQRRD